MIVLLKAKLDLQQEKEKSLFSYVLYSSPPQAYLMALQGVAHTLSQQAICPSNFVGFFGEVKNMDLL